MFVVLRKARNAVSEENCFSLSTFQHSSRQTALPPLLHRMIKVVLPSPRKRLPILFQFHRMPARKESFRGNNIIPFRLERRLNDTSDGMRAWKMQVNTTDNALSLCSRLPVQPLNSPPRRRQRPRLHLSSANFMLCATVDFPAKAPTQRRDSLFVHRHAAIHTSARWHTEAANIVQIKQLRNVQRETARESFFCCTSYPFDHDFQ